MAIVARHVRVTGIVQGVFFRAWTRGEAGRLGVTGWVRNCPDGTVEAHVEGNQAAVDAMVERMHRGPPGARVEELKALSVDRCDFDGFEVRH